MKSTFYIITLIAFVFAVASSCTKEEDTPIPSIAFKTGLHKPNVAFVSNDTTLFVGTKFAIGILAESNSSKNITRIKIVRKLDNGTPVTVKDSATSSATLDIVIPVKASGTAGFYEVFTCEVSDANNMKNSINFTIYTMPADPGIIEYKSVILASFQLHTFAHYFSISNGLTYDTADCVSADVQELIDIAYFDNQVYGHTMMSPNVTFLNNIYTGMVFWTNKNKTQFSKTLITTGAFDAIETIVDLTNAIQNAVDDFHLEFVDSNEEGDVLAFKNSDGIKGLMRISNTQTSANHGESFITFDVKIEK